VRKRIREYSGIIRQVLKVSGKFLGITTMDSVLNDVRNGDELGASDDNDVFK